ncbi:MAG: hypothetical protein ACRCYX_14370, partial [Dermatophilaceae bacterium]
ATITQGRLATDHAGLGTMEGKVRAAALHEAAGPPGMDAHDASETTGPRVRDILGMWPFWLLILVASGVVAAGVAYVVGLAGRLFGRTDEVREVAMVVAFPVIVALLVLWTLHAVLRRGDPLGLVDHNRSIRGLSPRRRKPGGHGG